MGSTQSTWGMGSLTLGVTRIAKYSRNIFNMKFQFAFIFAFVVYINAQDTYHCPDGWDLHAPEGTDECECYLFADNYARVNHEDAGLLCESHNGWLAELEDGPGDNYWVVQKLIDLREMGRQLPNWKEEKCQSSGASFATSLFL